MDRTQQKPGSGGEGSAAAGIPQQAPQAPIDSEGGGRVPADDTKHSGPGSLQHVAGIAKPEDLEELRRAVSSGAPPSDTSSHLLTR